jgi:hypothetical protein
MNETITEIEKKYCEKHDKYYEKTKKTCPDCLHEYYKSWKNTREDIIKNCLEFFYSIAGSKCSECKESRLNEEEISRFQSGFDKKQNKIINQIMNGA